MEVGKLHRSSRSYSNFIGKRKWVDVTVLIYINFLNYTDRYNLAGILIDIQEYFEIRNDKAGLIQTLFTLTYMVSAPLAGYLGDRYNRKVLLTGSFILWNASNVAASFMTEFWAFLIFRAIFGIGQAGYTTIAPSVISDLFEGDMRSRLLAVFYLGIPVGTGLGYIVGTQMASLLGSWTWGLRATPCIAIINIILLVVVLREPKRGAVEGLTDLETTSWIQDTKYLFTNASFMLSTLGFTAVAFAAGAVNWWAPKLDYLGFNMTISGTQSHTEGSIFGIVSAISGFVGVCVGYLVSFKLKDRFPRIDPLACGVGLIISGPLLFGATYTTMVNKIVTYVLLFVGLIGMNLNWALTMVICLGVVMPSRRASAVGVQLLVGHGLGDAGSPYLTGLISDVLYDYFKEKWTDTSDNLCEFRALQYAYFIAITVEVLGSSFFFINAVYIVRDMEKVRQDTEERRD